MKNRIIGALSMLALLNVPALVGMSIGVTYWKAYLISFCTTMSVSIAYSIIEYLKSKLETHVGKSDAKTV